MFKTMKLGLTFLALLVVTGCASNQAGRDYYLAMQAAAQENAKASTARYQALSQLAQSGDPGAATAATMAIALSNDPVIAPQYVESSALKWAQVLAAPVTTLGLGVVQAGVAKNASDNAAQIQMASFASNEAIQIGQQNMVTGLGSQWANAAVAGADVAVAGFTALNTAGQQTVDLGIAGLDTADSIAGAGFDANTTIAGLGFATADSIATTGFTTVDSVATTGMEGMATLGLAGMTNLNEVSQYGMTTIGAVATTGMTNMTTISGAGMDGIQAIGTAGMTNLTTLGTTGIDAVGTVGTTGMNLLDQQGTNYTAIIADMQTTIDQLGAELADPITCSPNADGLYVCQ
jgi:hypothetical protein